MGENTEAVHLPEPRPFDQRPLALPVHRSSTFAARTSAEYADLLADRRSGYVYGRTGNPTSEAFAAAVAALEAGGAEAVEGEAFPSGMAAISTLLFTVCTAGSHVVAPTGLYGGTYELLTGVLAGLGVRTSFVDYADIAAVRAAVRDDTAVVLAETITNPTTAVADLPALAELARAAATLLAVDSTFASPAVCRPLQHGADVVVHSATKYLGGHSDATGGVVVGSPALMARVRRCRRQLGAVLAPDEAYLLHRGLATLPLRVRRHCESAMAFAAAMADSGAVCGVAYPGLADHPQHELARRLFHRGRYGGVVTLRVAGGRDGAARCCDRLRLAAVAASLGGTHTLVSPVATTTHRQLDDSALASAGIDPGDVRVSIGLEDVEDLVADMLAALAGGPPARLARGGADAG